VIYRWRATPLHAARAAAGGAYCAALTVAALTLDHPLILGALLVALLGAALITTGPAPLRRALRLGLSLAAVSALLNPLFAHYGLTVLARLGEFGPLGQVDITLEALVYGAISGLKILILFVIAAVAAAAVDPDELLRLSRRVSSHSALVASLATRMWSVLEGDAHRRAEAQRCRADWAASRSTRSGRMGTRVAILRAVTAGALDRAVDVAATLEVRGHVRAGRPGPDPRPLSRHDVAFFAAAAALIILTVGARLTGVGSFSADPLIRAPLGPAEAILATAVIAVSLVPFADRRGVDR